MGVAIRKALLLGIGLTIALAGARVSRGDLIYQTGFEAAQGFTAGSSVDGQAGWVSVASPAAGVVSTVNPAAGLQDLQINGPDLQYFPNFGVYQGAYRYDTLVNGITNPRVLVQLDMRLDGPQTFPPIVGDLTSANFVLSNLAALEISSDGHVYADDENSTFYQFGTAVTPGQYHRLGILLDFGAQSESFYADGSLLGTLALPAGGPTSFFVYTALISLPDSGSYSHGDYTGYFDNLSIQSVPEPSGLLLAGFGGLGLAASGRRRSRTRRGSI